MHGVLLVALATLAGIGGSSVTPPPAVHTVRVRGLDARAKTVVSEMIAGSPTAARMLRQLDRSDLIVLVQTDYLPASLGGDLSLVSATPQWRFVRIRVSNMLPLREQVGMLGHELQHALEVAANPRVRDQTAMRRLYEQIGHGAWGGPYETTAAREVGALVLREMATR